jgi:hypothetical protein
MVEKKKEADIGMKKARLICDMRPDRRLEFIAEGLPILFASAKSLIMASQALKQFPREAEILEGHCEEECAKILILLDIIRCPKKKAGQRVKPMMRWFYCHLTRLLYAQAQRWRLVNAVELQEFIDRERKSHHLYGEDGYEDILPNWALFERESSLYADVVLAESGDAVWHSPVEMFEGAWRPDDYYLPTSFRVVEALEAFGVFTSEGLKVLAEVWGKYDVEGEFSIDPRHPFRELVQRLDAAGLITEHATEDHERDLLNNWQIPMYNMEFARMPVTLEELVEQRAANRPNYW